jgi:formylmethanofuran dehydrogenase subunit E
MRHALAYESVGFCQLCDEPLTSRDVLETGQARLCPECYDQTVKFSWSQTGGRTLEAR